jgi:hypothetical protein
MIVARIAVYLSLLGGCLYNADTPCGPAMDFDAASGVCVCQPDAISTGTGCTACAADEVVVDGACACPAGEAKDAADVCVVAHGLGDACQSDADCTSAMYGRCAPTDTCTNACASDADCGGSFTCAVWEPRPYCRAWSGLGDTCTSNADCVGTDAVFCDTYQSHTCIVQGCSLTADDCPRDNTCCDFSSYGLGTLCAGACQ